MLHLVLGRAGSGKTVWARERLAQSAGTETTEGHPQSILIVPEQYSFESERAILHGMDRAAHRTYWLPALPGLQMVFRTYGGIAGRRLTDGGRMILMRLAIDGAEDFLRLYGKNARTGEMIRLLVSAEAEMKMCAVSPETLEEPDCSRRTKCSGKGERPVADLFSV